MTLNEYQKLSRGTAIYVTEYNIIYPALGLCGEAGEVAEKVKRIIRDGKRGITPEIREEIKKELGDVLWYLANLAFDLGLNLNDIATENLNKLYDRQERNKLHGSGDNR